MRFKKIFLVTLLLVAMLSVSMVGASDDADNFAGDDIMADGLGEMQPGDPEGDFDAYVNEENVDINDINETLGVSFYCPENYNGSVRIEFTDDTGLDTIVYNVNESVWDTNVVYLIPDLGISETGRYRTELFFQNDDDEWWLGGGFISVVDYNEFWVNENISFGWPQPIDLDVPFQLYYPVGSAGKEVIISVKRWEEEICNIVASTSINDTSGFIDFTWEDLNVGCYGLSVHDPVEYSIMFTYEDEVIFKGDYEMASPLWAVDCAYIGGMLDAATVASVGLDPRIDAGNVIILIDGEQCFNKTLDDISSDVIEGGPNNGRVAYQICIDNLDTEIKPGDYVVELIFTNENVTVSDYYEIKIYNATSVVEDNESDIAIVILKDEVYVQDATFIQIAIPVNTTGNVIITWDGESFIDLPIEEMGDCRQSGNYSVYDLYSEYFEFVDLGTHEINVTFSGENGTLSNDVNVTFLSAVTPKVLPGNYLCDDDIRYFAFVELIDEWWNEEVIVLLNGTEYFHKYLNDFDGDHVIYHEYADYYLITPDYLDEPVAPGTYEVEITCSDYHLPESGIVTFYDDGINIDAPDVEKYFGGPERFYVNVTDGAFNPIANATVNITINDVTYKRVTDENGSASIGLGLNSRTYEVYVQCNETVVVSRVFILPTVDGDDVTKMFRNGTQYYATFYDSEGKTLGNHTEVEFNINGVFYKRYTNENGTARMNINLNPGEYIITAKNPVTGEQYTNLIEVLPTIVENDDLVKYYRNDSQYVVTILDDEGNPVKAGVNVTFNINGVFYTRQTNESGQAKLSINLEPGEYVITAQYNGLMASNNITVLSVIETENLNMKYQDGSYFNATILDGQGKPLANANVTFNINGVFYNKVTDENGVARLKINLMAGEYIITTTYNGLNAANKITISS